MQPSYVYKTKGCHSNRSKVQPLKKYYYEVKEHRMISRESVVGEWLLNFFNTAYVSIENTFFSVNGWMRYT